MDDFTTVPKTNIERLWREFRFPDGYAPRSVRFGNAFNVAEYQHAQRKFAERNKDTAFEANEQCKSEIASRQAKISIM